MTLRDLSQLYWLGKEIDADTQRLKELESKAYAPGGSDLDGVHRSAGPSSPTEQYAIAIQELRDKIEANRIRCVEEQNRLQDYIDGIDDSLTREIYKMRFVYKQSWAKIAAELNNSEDSVKKICYRYMRKHE